MTTYSPPLPARPHGPWFGWGISLLVHACVLAWLVHVWQAAPPVAAPADRMHFVLVPPKPQAQAPAQVPAPVAVEVPAAVTPAAKDRAAPARAARSRPAPAVPAPASSSAAGSATPAEPAAATAPDAATVPTAADAAPAAAGSGTADAGAGTDAGTGAGTGAGAGAGESAPHLDVKAARATARLSEKHRKDGLVAFPKPDPPLHRDERLERAIERARRGDCKTAYSGLGLLAVIPLAKDAITGTGCKW